MEIKAIQANQVEAISHCFNQAFADYFVPFKVNADYLRHRWKAARINYELSFAAFADGIPVGFIITGIDQLNGRLTAYNAGTGVIPAFRGQQIIDRIYEHAIPLFRSKGIQQCSLEVITKNERAIKVYARIGFKTIRQLDCFKGDIGNASAPQKEIQMKLVSKPNWEKYQPCCDVLPAWDNAQKAININQTDYEFWEVHDMENNWIGFIIINPDTTNIPQFGILKTYRQQGFGQAVFQEIKKRIASIKINNVDHQAESVGRFLKRTGLDQHISQYEMLMNI